MRWDRLWKVTDAEGHVTTTRYYPDGKVWKVIDAKGNNSVVNTYYGDGSLKNVKDAKDNVTQYEYNGFKGLKKTTYPDSTYEQPTYDSYRRVTQARGRSGQTISLTYDGLNRVKTKTVKDPNDITTNTITYKYDLLGRLYRVTDNSGVTKNTYDKGRIDIRSATEPDDREPSGRLLSFVRLGTLSPGPWDLPLSARGRIEEKTT